MTGEWRVNAAGFVVAPLDWKGELSMSFADRMDKALEERDAELWDAHERGEHETQLDHDCNRCHKDAREALNREGDPAFNGAFNAW